MELQLPVARPPWSGRGLLIESQIRKALYEDHMLKGVNKLTVALSGGKDSLTLLYMLAAISGRGFPKLELSAVHVTGKFSCGAGVSLDYLQAICDSLDIQLLVREATQERETLECYSCSRQRRKLIFEAAKSVGSETIAFGHHRDDNIQTLLMNLLHKGEFAGNLSNLHMQHYGITLIRPLIFVDEASIRLFAEEQGFSRLMCRCPVGQNSMRKQTDQLLSEIEQLYPHARQNLARAARLYGSDKAKQA